MTLNNCASMKLEVHFQCKQVSHGKSGVCDLAKPWETQDVHRPLSKLVPVSQESRTSTAVPCSSLGAGCQG